MNKNKQTKALTKALIALRRLVEAEIPGEDCDLTVAQYNAACRLIALLEGNYHEDFHSQDHR